MEVKTYDDIEHCSSLISEGDMGNSEGRQINVKQAEKNESPTTPATSVDRKAGSWRRRHCIVRSHVGD